MPPIILRARSACSYLAIRPGDLVTIEFGRDAWIERRVGRDFWLIRLMLEEGELEPITPIPLPAASGSHGPAVPSPRHGARGAGRAPRWRRRHLRLV